LTTGEEARATCRNDKPGLDGCLSPEARAGIRQAPVTYTDNTSWVVGGEPAQLMVFDTDQATVYQIRPQHRNQEVRELVPGDYRGTLVTDRGPSYEAKALAGVEQQKCLSHLMRNVKEVLETKSGRAREFGEGVLNTLKQANQLWRDHRAGKMDGEAFRQQGQEIENQLTHQLRQRQLTDPDNQRLLDGIGWQNGH
jgi:transposase